MVKLAAMLVDPRQPMEFIISEAKGSPIVHTGIILDDGQMVYSQYHEGVVRREVDVADPARWLVIDLPWVMNADCLAWIESTLGAAYNWVGCLFSAIRGRGISYAGEWFCSQHSAALISRLSGGPQSLPPLVCPAELVRMVRGAIDPGLLETAGKPQNLKPVALYLRDALRTLALADRWAGNVVRAEA